jgi:hypothetical protein
MTFDNLLLQINQTLIKLYKYIVSKSNSLFKNASKDAERKKYE